MSNNNSDSIDFENWLQPDAYMQEDDTMDCPFDWDWEGQYGAHEGGQIVAAPASSDNSYGWNAIGATQNGLGIHHDHLHTGADSSNGMDPQPYFHHGTMRFEYQGFASGLEASTSNSTVCQEFPSSSVSGAYGYATGNASDTMLMSSEVAYEDPGSAIGTEALTDNHPSSHDLSPSRSGSGPSSLSANNDITNVCACITCFVKQERKEAWRRRPSQYHCVVGCTHQFNVWSEYSWREHLKTHFKQDKKYHCKAPQCGQVLTRWGELTRHYKNHCLRPKKFACDVLGCKYGGDNGFIRHDKLLSHKRNVHDGKAPPSQLMRRLQAKPRS